MNTRAFTILALMVGGALLVLPVTSGVRLVAAQVEVTAPSAPALPARGRGGTREVERLVHVPAMAGTPGSLASDAAPAAIAAGAEHVELVGHIGGRMSAIFVQGHYAYVGVVEGSQVQYFSN
jgi:hypothetical protein